MPDDISTKGWMFVRVMRETGSWEQACKQSNMTTAEVENLCRSKPMFDRTQTEAQLEFHTKRLIEATEAVITQAREQRADRIRLLREQAMMAYYARHPDG